eukprot:TRINITY_DN6323_c3_g1_i1.p1 TRINITY_DN6323_c3_g1~~TRINITY_DN6323_c3_g1_i1.p1  ORF type:complete len:170 (+),score=29.92 TRINITY_DN6323_c3_g1_i1:72-512(+)
MVLMGISPVISPDLLDALYRMGHGDEIVLADAHFPGESMGVRVVRADGLKIPQLLEGILELFPLDEYVENPLSMMDAVKGDTLDPAVTESYMAAIKKSNPKALDPARIERFQFYEVAKKAYCVVMTGETAKYGNIILKKGVVPIKQ